jgi:hypothetical protein
MSHSHEAELLTESLEDNKPAQPVKLKPDKIDLDVQTVRRLDWRFLLPDTNLGCVAYLGSIDKTLIKGLDQFGMTLSVFNASHEISDQSNYDLVVLRSHKVSYLNIASSLLRNEGYLYWEIDRSNRLAFLGGMLNWIRRRGLSVLSSKTESNQGAADFHDYLTGLSQAGFDEMGVFWHRPNFEACREIIPLDQRFALDYVFSQEQWSFSGKVKFATGRLFAKLGLLTYLVPCFSIVATKRH